ncbi:MAG TPA: proline--tRNA ligase [Candidatus Ornithoclostridium excrementipullorum]|nr:proline--tRNA ligase [Candidatus Ornithoclostridium excrementipullorum]
MLLSKLVCERMKEVPQDAKIKSHVLLVRAGFIKQVAGGIYTMTMPCQKMSLKIQKIIREEMDAEDGQEVLFPVVMPRELWEQSGRYSSIGQEMVRFKDRGDRDMLLGMTHEEAAVHLANHTVSSYQQLPMMIYQLQTKFRDEARPRGGLIRVREFTMKDAYSFHCDSADLEKYYYRMYDAYYRIFRRIGLKNFIDVKSDSGMMGGSVAHEFMLITPDGEDSIVFCNDCDYRANMEVAVSVIDRPEAEDEPMREIYTGEDKTIEEVCARLNIPASRTVKAVVYAVKGDSDELVVAFIRGDLEVNEAKLKKVLGKNVVAYDGGISEDIVCGNIGAIGLSDKIVKVFDKSLEGCKGMVTGANKPEYHIAGVNVARDFGDVTFVDVAKAAAGHRCPVCGGALRVENGIEIGNIFQLGTKYTASMNMTVNGPDGTAFNPIMGCYGIGVGRAIGSIAQESNDEYGLILPMSVAPWQVHICALRYDDDAVRSKADKLYADLRAAGVEVLFDDRNCGAGVKFADADLMGMPIRVVISPKTLAEDKVEIKLRREKTAERVDLSEAVSEICRTIEKELEALK